MIYDHVFLLAAIQEYGNSVKWYRKKSHRAAENFISTVEKGIETICVNPRTFKSLYQNYHELPLKTYPFTIIYKIEDEYLRIRIVTVYHQSRNPKLKYR